MPASRRGRVPAFRAQRGIKLPSADPHVAWWRDREQLGREIDEAEGLPHEDELVSRQVALDDLIAGTAPTTIEGAAVVATVLLWWQGENAKCYEGGYEHLEPAGDMDAEAGGTLARYFLASLPADVLRRAGLEG